MFTMMPDSMTATRITGSEIDLNTAAMIRKMMPIDAVLTAPKS